MSNVDRQRVAAVRKLEAMGYTLSADSGLKDVAALCKRDFAARPARDWNDVRDQLLVIGIEWNLDCDRLDQQSDPCLRAIGDFLR
jgi:hypothetical protein